MLVRHWFLVFTQIKSSSHPVITQSMYQFPMQSNINYVAVIALMYLEHWHAVLAFPQVCTAVVQVDPMCEYLRFASTLFHECWCRVEIVSALIATATNLLLPVLHGCASKVNWACYLMHSGVGLY